MRVLLVEDEELTQVAVELSLTSLFKDTVAIANNGKQALDWIAANGDPDVILLDIAMPVMDGNEFMRQYKGEAPIIVMSAFIGVKPLPIKPFAAVQKPMSIRQMHGIMEAAVASKSGQSSQPE